MKILHRVGFRATDSQRRELESLGLKLPPGLPMPGGGDPFLAFDVAEDHQQWSRIQALLHRWGVSAGDVTTTFSKDELEAAEWLELIPDWHHGYPQPDEPDFGYLKVTYDLTDWCEQCGIGLRQKAAFQMKGEPRWGRKAIFQLNWIFDEYFVTPQVWSSVFEPRGIGCRDVTDGKGAKLKTVVQLVVDEEVGIVASGLVLERCAKCGRTKYLPVTRGPFPALNARPARAMVKTKEYFGSGASAHKRVLVSQELARSLIAEKVRGASFWPVLSCR